jgi:hypothetical protein
MLRFTAALLAAALVALAWAPHAHAGPRGAHECAACVVRGSEAASSEPLELAPELVRFVAAAAVAPAEPPRTGAPLGAIPGQSPPA